MESYEAISRAIGKEAVAHARRLRLSTRLIYKWMEPSADFTSSGAYNPLDRVEEIIAGALRLGKPQEDAFALIYFLAYRFGGVYLPCPPSNCDLGALSKQLVKCIQEFSECAAETAKALDDDFLSPVERKRIIKEGHDAVAAITQLIRMAKEAR